MRPTPPVEHNGLVGRAQRRREFLSSAAGFLGAVAMHSLAGAASSRATPPHYRPRAQRAIWLFQSGAPSQLELFDPKPQLARFDGEEMPQSLVAGQPVSQIKGRRMVVAAPRVEFAPRGACGMELSNLLPHLGSIADDIALVRSMQSQVIVHDEACTFVQTGHSQPGRPALGAWLSYGLGTMNRDLPAYVVLNSSGDPACTGPATRLWGSGFLPGVHQGVALRPGQEIVASLSNPQGVTRRLRRSQLDALRALDHAHQQQVHDPEIETRIEAHELAFRMQASVPEIADLSDESDDTLALYGVERGKPSYATNCLLARRLIERGVRFVQLFHGGWDHHYRLNANIKQLTAETDRASAALVIDLKRRGLLDDTLVVWGGEFGRTPMNQGGQAGDRFGRDHHGKAFATWLAGGGVKGGTVVGRTDEFGYDVVESPVQVHDLQATVLHLLGIDHEALTFRHQGRDFRLTDVNGEVVESLLA